MPKSGNGHSRLDRIEAILETVATRQSDMEDEFRRLLRAQVVVVDTMGQLAAEQVKLAEQQRNTEEALNSLITTVDGTEEKLNALISIVDDIVRRTPRQQ